MRVGEQRFPEQSARLAAVGGELSCGLCRGGRATEGNDRSSSSTERVSVFCVSEEIILKAS